MFRKVDMKLFPAHTREQRSSISGVFRKVDMKLFPAHISGSVLKVGHKFPPGLFQTLCFENVLFRNEILSSYDVRSVHVHVTGQY